jgi:hypothetical protein
VTLERLDRGLAVGSVVFDNEDLHDFSLISGFCCVSQGTSLIDVALYHGFQNLSRVVDKESLHFKK